MNLPAFLSLRRMSAEEILLNGMAVYWLLMLPAVFGHANAGSAATSFLLLPAMILMFWVTAKKLTEVARAATVLRQLRAPGGLWRQMNARALRYTGLVWLFVATGCTLQMFLPGPGVSPLAGAALMSLVALLAAARSLSAAPRVGDIAIGTVALPLLMFAPGALFDWFGTLPGALLAIIAVSFPVLLLWLEQRWRHAPPAFSWAVAQRASTWLDLLRAQLRRFTVLAWKNAPSDAGQDPASHVGRLLLTGLPVLMLMFNSAPVYADGRIMLIRFATLILLTLLLMAGLVVRDLHWRSLLAPGGLRRGRLGFQIWFWTMAVQFALLGACIGTAMLLLRFGFDYPLPKASALLARHATLPLEIAFATAIAVAVRALPHFGFWAVLMVLATNVAVYLAWNTTAASAGKMALPLPLYVGLMAGATLLLVLLANRLWTLKKLKSVALPSSRTQWQRL